MLRRHRRPRRRRARPSPSGPCARYRDQRLARHNAGRVFTRLYYRYGRYGAALPAPLPRSSSRSCARAEAARRLRPHAHPLTTSFEPLCSAGLGSGHLSGGRGRRAVAADLVAACIRDDPRLDHQLDDPQTRAAGARARRAGLAEDDLGIPVLGPAGDPRRRRRAARAARARGRGRPLGRGDRRAQPRLEDRAAAPDCAREDGRSGSTTVLVDRFGSDLCAALWDASRSGRRVEALGGGQPVIADALADDTGIDDEWRPPLLRTSILRITARARADGARAAGGLAPGRDGAGQPRRRRRPDPRCRARRGARDAARGDPRAGSARTVRSWSRSRSR